MLHQLMDARGGYLENYRCVDGCQKLNTSTKAVCVTQLSDELIIQLIIQSHCRHYTSGVNVDNKWFLISDTRISRQQKLKRSSRDISIPYILIYKKRSNFLVAPPISLNGTTGVSSTSELISETAETMIRQSVLLELEKQKAKLAMDQQKEKTNSNKVKSPVKRKPKFTNRRSSKENDKKRKKFIRDNFDEDEKEQLKKVDKNRKKEMCDNFEEKKNIQKKRITKAKKKSMITLIKIKKIS